MFFWKLGNTESQDEALPLKSFYAEVEKLQGWPAMFRSCICSTDKPQIDGTEDYIESERCGTAHEMNMARHRRRDAKHDWDKSEEVAKVLPRT